MVMKGERVELECEVSEEGANVKWLDTLLNALVVLLFEMSGGSSVFSRFGPTQVGTGNRTVSGYDHMSVGFWDLKQASGLAEG